MSSWAFLPPLIVLFAGCVEPSGSPDDPHSPPLSPVVPIDGSYNVSATYVAFSAPAGSESEACVLEARYPDPQGIRAQLEAEFIVADAPGRGLENVRTHLVWLELRSLGDGPIIGLHVVDQNITIDRPAALPATEDSKGAERTTRVQGSPSQWLEASGSATGARLVRLIAFDVPQTFALEVTTSGCDWRMTTGLAPTFVVRPADFLADALAVVGPMWTATAASFTVPQGPTDFFRLGGYALPATATARGSWTHDGESGAFAPPGHVRVGRAGPVEIRFDEVASPLQGDVAVVFLTDIPDDSLR